MLKSVFRLTLLAFVFSLSFSAKASILSKTDVQLYQDIFEAHEQGQYSKAKTLESKLSNDALKGYILYDKYFSPRYRTSSTEVNSFLQRYRHLPIATDVYALGKRKKFKISSKAPKDPVYGSQANTCSYIRRDEPINLITRQKFKYLSGQKQKRAKAISKQLKRLIERNRLKLAIELLNKKETQTLFRQKDKDIVLTAVAFSYFLINNDIEAIKYADKAITHSSKELPLAHWTKGLASWRTKDFKTAATSFETAATHADGYPLLRGSAGFWAARAYLKIGDFKKVGDFLELASDQPRTFYGLLALHMLGDNLENILDEETHPELKRHLPTRHLPVFMR